MPFLGIAFLDNFCLCNRKRACAVSMQWLRGRRADIGAEFSLMADTLGRMDTLASGRSIFDTLIHRWEGLIESIHVRV